MSKNDFTPVAADSKKCKGCGEIKPLDQFYRCSILADGRENHCKTCRTLARGQTPRPPRSTTARLFPEQGIAEIPLTRGYVAVVDIVDADLAEFKWSVFLSPWQNYARRKGRVDHNESSAVFLHRVILERVLGGHLLSPSIEEVDHINLNGLDCRRSNLRLAAQGENARNTSRWRRSTSGYKGVGFHKHEKRWIARIQVDRKRIHLGYFDTPEEAHAAYCEAAKKYHGEFARFE